MVEATILGKSVLWFVAGLIGVQACWLYAMTATMPMDQGFHMLAFAVCAIAMLGYFTMALGLGDVMVDGRPVFFARYCDWAFTTPIIMIDVGILFQLNYSDIFGLCVWDILMIMSGLFGALTSGSAKYPLYVFSCVCFLVIGIRLRYVFDDFSAIRSKNLTVRAKRLLISMAIIWSGYPIVWVLAEGQGIISVDAEIALYGFLDVTAKTLLTCAITVIMDVPGMHAKNTNAGPAVESGLLRVVKNNQFGGGSKRQRHTQLQHHRSRKA